MTIDVAGGKAPPERYRRRVGIGRDSTSAFGRPGSLISLGLVALLTIVAALAGVLAPHDPVQPIGGLALKPFSPGYPLGTDSIGRDLLSRTLIGIRTSWFSALLVVVVGLLVGGLIGLLAGSFGGWVDSLLMRLTDLFLALPGTLVAIAIVAALGSSLRNTLIGISIVWWPYYARIIRGEVRAIASRPHVEAARLSGVGRGRLVLRHILPGAIPTAIVTASLDIGNVVLLLAGLSFLGLGRPAPAPELGADTARTLSLLLTDWWVPVIPGLAVMLLSLIANLGGDGLRNLLAGRR
jgi:peptide/nickel transport system permease protein